MNEKLRVLVVNHKVKNCGVYQYGKRFSSILTSEKYIEINNKYTYFYLESDTELELITWVDAHSPDIIIYNHLTGTMPYVNQDIVSEFRKRNIIQGTIVHNVGYSTFFDFYLHQDPNFIDVDQNYHIFRPLFDNTDGSQESYHATLEERKCLKIGSFGFGFNVKRYDELCSIVNYQLSKKDFKVIINLHLTLSHFCDNTQMLQDVIASCKNQITSKNIELNVTTNFITDEEVLSFLNDNDLNVFLYHNYGGYNGISSVIDYALSSSRPFAVCKSNMFSHVNSVTPSICIEDSSLEDILKNGRKSIDHLAEKWSQKNFKKRLDQVLEKVRSSHVF